MEARAWAHVGQSGAPAGGRREMCSGKRRVSREPHSATRQRVVHCEPATSLPLRCFPFRFLTSVRFLLRDGPPSNEAALPKVPTAVRIEEKLVIKGRGRHSVFDVD